jgi:hypothetical protein
VQFRGIISKIAQSGARPMKKHSIVRKKSRQAILDHPAAPSVALSRYPVFTPSITSAAESYLPNISITYTPCKHSRNSTSASRAICTPSLRQSLVLRM